MLIQEYMRYNTRQQPANNPPTPHDMQRLRINSIIISQVPMRLKSKRQLAAACLRSCGECLGFLAFKAVA